MVVEKLSLTPYKKKIIWNYHGLDKTLTAIRVQKHEEM